jgi:hypothetical protein
VFKAIEIKKYVELPESKLGDKCFFVILSIYGLG